MLKIYNEIQFSNKSELTIDTTCNNMNGSQNYYAEWRKPDKSVCAVLFNLCMSRQCKVTYSGRKHTSGYLEMLRMGLREDWPRRWGHFWGWWYVQSLESGDGFTGVYMSKFTKLYTFSMCSLLCINYISILKITITRVEKKEGHVGWDVLWQPSWKIQPISFTKCFQHARHCVCSCFYSTVTESPNNPTWGGDEEMANYLLLLLLLLFWLSLSHEVLVLGGEECLGSSDQDLGVFTPEL